MGFSRQEYWSALPFPSQVDHILSELSTMTRPFWVALHNMAHSFIELDKTVVHVIRLVSCLWLWFSVCLPSNGVTAVWRWSSGYAALEQPWGDTPHRRAKEEPQQDGWRGEFMFRIKPHSCQRCLEGSNKAFYAPRPRDPTEAETELCLSISCGGTGQQWTAIGTGALGVADLGMA